MWDFEKGMLLVRWIVLLLALFSLNALATVNWSKTSLRDIKAIHSILEHDTVAAIDPEDPTFRLWLNIGYQKAHAMALKVKTLAGFAAVDQFYVNGFHDYHVAIVSRPWPPSIRYPGFLMYYTGTHYEVSSVAHLSSKIPVDALLLSCDHHSPNQLMKKIVLPYFGNPKLQSSWIYNASRLLTNWNNPFSPAPQRCVFKDKKQLMKVPLHWQKVNQRSLNVWLKQAAYPYQPQFAISQLDKDSVWVNFPSFKPRKTHPADLLQMKRITNQFEHWRNKKRVIVDVRGNRGGNSHWADVMLRGLYGTDYFKWAFRAQPPFRNQYRLSALTIKTFERHVRDYINFFGASSKKTQALQKMLDKMKAAYKRGDKLFPRLQPRRVRHPGKQPDPLYKGQLFIVMDGRCNSACLTFIYEAKRFPRVMLLGKTSGADTLYTESTAVKLPSNLTLSLSISKSIGRDRLSNQPYYPDIVYPGDINNTDKLQRWVQQRR